MADLYPIPFPTLVDRLRRELSARDAVFTLKRRDWWVPDPARDLSLRHHGHLLGNPAGPASGPHTQLAQNIVMAWLAGGRFFELKTVQVLDELVIPRPCIQVPHVGYNVEWSQELRVDQSAFEYAKAWLLVHALAHRAGLWEEASAATAFDLSLGYDLAGIRAPKVRRFLDQMRDPEELFAALREGLDPESAAWLTVPRPQGLSRSVTLSTFHGCPAHEVEAIAAQTLDWGWHTVVKLNPTLMGFEAARAALDELGYGFIELDPADFARDLQWGQLVDMVPRLAARARALGLGFGVKLTNTLISRRAEAFEGTGEVYVSGPPLHVLALTLAERFVARFPDVPVTFSAGVDKNNFAGLVGAGLGPVTTCSDLLKARGYARLPDYLRALEKDMATRGAGDVAAYRAADPGLAALAAATRADPRYARGANAAPPRKVGSQLVLLDCLTCDRCVPVCPNGANFTVPVETGEWSPGRLAWEGERFTVEPGAELVATKRHQIGNVADACNRCGQCDTWCPEDGGPYLVKPAVFLSEASFDDQMDRDGFLVDPDRRGIRWRREGATWHLRRDGDGAVLSTEGGQVRLAGDRPVATAGRGSVDLTVAVTMRLFLDAFARPETEAWLPPSGVEELDEAP